MWRIRTHRLGIDRGSTVLFSDFEHGGQMWAGEGAREVRADVAFSEPFVTAPIVHVGMSMWDSDGSINQRMDIAAENVTPGGFEIVFRTWGDSKVARARADWVAMGEVSHEEDWNV